MNNNINYPYNINYYQQQQQQEPEKKENKMNAVQPFFNAYPTDRKTQPTFQQIPQFVPQQFIQAKEFPALNPASNPLSLPLLHFKSDLLPSFFLRGQNDLSNKTSEALNRSSRLSSSISTLTPMNGNSYSPFFPQQPQSMLSPLSPNPLIMQLSSMMATPAAKLQNGNFKHAFPTASFQVNYQPDSSLGKDIRENSEFGNKRKYSVALDPESPSTVQARNSFDRSSPHSTSSHLPTDSKAEVNERSKTSSPLTTSQGSPLKKKRKGPYLRSACVACYDEKVKCCPSNITDENGIPGPCERCILKNRQCIKVLERKRGRKSKKELADLS